MRPSNHRRTSLPSWRSGWLHLVVLGIEGVEASAGVQRLDRGEHVIAFLGARAAHEILAEGRVPEHVAEGGQALIQQPFPMGHEE